MKTIGEYSIHSPRVVLKKQDFPTPDGAVEVRCSICGGRTKIVGTKVIGSQEGVSHMLTREGRVTVEPLSAANGVDIIPSPGIYFSCENGHSFCYMFVCEDGHTLLAGMTRIKPDGNPATIFGQYI